MREFLSANPSVKRADIFITTKVWNHLHEPEDVEWSINSSLEKLQTPYVDAFLIHWPIAAEKNPDRSVKIGADGKVSTFFPRTFSLPDIKETDSSTSYATPKRTYDQTPFDKSSSKCSSYDKPH